MIVRHARIIGEEQWPWRIRERLTETSRLNGWERIYPILPRERGATFLTSPPPPKYSIVLESVKIKMRERFLLNWKMMDAHHRWSVHKNLTLVQRVDSWILRFNFVIRREIRNEIRDEDFVQMQMWWFFFIFFTRRYFVSRYLFRE